MRFNESLHTPWYVVLSALMVVLLCLIRILAYFIEGHDDETLAQVLTAVLAMFTGSFAVARAASNGKHNGNGDNN